MSTSDNNSSSNESSSNKPSRFKNLSHKQRQIGLIIMVLVIGIILALAILANGNKSNNQDAHNGHDNHAEEGHAEDEHEEAGHSDAQDKEEPHEQVLNLTQTQLAAQNIQLATVALGRLNNVIQLPARVVVNTDQQAHVSAGFSGLVQQVHVQVGQHVRQGQALASLLVPDLIDMQSNLKILQSQRTLANSHYQREKNLWQQGISAKQDYLQAQNDYEQANIMLQASQARLKAYAGNANSAGRFVVKAPIAGVISSKDLVIGESIQATDQLFVLDQLSSLWLEFVVPDALVNGMDAGQRLSIEVPNTTQRYDAKFMYLNPSADAQTGRYIARASVANTQLKLRPNMQVLVSVPSAVAAPTNSMVINAQAVQQLEQRNVVFVASPLNSSKGNIELMPRVVQLGNKSTDQTQVEVLSGLKLGEQYVTQGSFVLKSELQKGEATHEH